VLNAGKPPSSGAGHDKDAAHFAAGREGDMAG